MSTAHHTVSGADIFLHLQTKRAGKVKGEAATTGHTDDIAVAGWHWGLSASSALGVMNYVDGDPANLSDVVEAQKPLAAAEVPGNPGDYQSKFLLRPHYQLEGLTMSLRPVSKLPPEKQ